MLYLIDSHFKNMAAACTIQAIRDFLILRQQPWLNQEINEREKTLQVNLKDFFLNVVRRIRHLFD